VLRLIRNASSPPFTWWVSHGAVAPLAETPVNNTGINATDIAANNRSRIT
jgi:hypothetical protein